MIIVLNVAPTDGRKDIPDYDTTTELALKTAYFQAKKDYEKKLLDGLAHPIGNYSSYIPDPAIKSAK